MIVKGLQLRKEHDAFEHEYLLVVLTDGSIYRIDRRPDPTLSIDTLMRHGCNGVDTLQEVASFDELRPSSDPVVQIECEEAKADFIIVLLGCFAIAQDETARRYSIQRFNCYFFAWTNILLFLRSLLGNSWQHLLLKSAMRNIGRGLLDTMIQMINRDIKVGPRDLLSKTWIVTAPNIASEVALMMQDYASRLRWKGLWQSELNFGVTERPIIYFTIHKPPTHQPEPWHPVFRRGPLLHSQEVEPRAADLRRPHPVSSLDSAVSRDRVRRELDNEWASLLRWCLSSASFEIPNTRIFLWSRPNGTSWFDRWKGFRKNSDTKARKRKRLAGYTYFQELAQKTFWRHARRVDRYQLGSAVDVHKDMTEAIERIWLANRERYALTNPQAEPPRGHWAFVPEGSRGLGGQF